MPGIAKTRSLEVRFFAPGNLVGNLDFVESIFGNAGDPFLPENDSALDAEGWTGHTGCAILAPHLIRLTKKELGLPPKSEATERQVKDGMCWEDPAELYNDGGAFKITCRDRSGVIVTLIADNYFGYCKKEVKSQISYACNLLGGTEEEHAGGAIAFPSFDHGEDFTINPKYTGGNRHFDDVVALLGDRIELKPEGFGVDRKFPDIVYLPQDASIDQSARRVSWTQGSETRSIKLRDLTTYVYPSGYKVELRRPSAGRRWRLVGTQAEGTFCHKPCTVSGGGKSEISKPLSDAMTVGPVIVPDLPAALEKARGVIERSYWNRFPDPRTTAETSRPILSSERSLGSVLKLLTPSHEFTEEHNEYISSLPRPVLALTLLIKRLYKPDWGDWEQWAPRFSSDIIDGQPGFELKFDGKKILTRYLRLGFKADGSWRTFSLRNDFLPATKLQREDDISASAVWPVTAEDGLHPDVPEGSHKFVDNCEFRFFQRPDDAVIRGYDKAAEIDFSRSGNFFSNYQPLDQAELRDEIEDAVRFDAFTTPLRDSLLAASAAGSPEFVVTPAHPRIVNGAPSKNPRYLQDRADLHHQRPEYLAEVGMHLYRRVPVDQPVVSPVNAVLPGRRHNPPDPEAGIRALAVFNPIHYQELPELFMDYIASLTGKSPSTTGAGSEGALTKGPFNPLPQIIDLNNALVAAMLTRQPHFISAAGYVGPNFRVDHDVSLIVPEVWSRMHISERDPATMIAEGLLESCADLGIPGAERLGFRITRRFVNRYFGRVFADPAALFSKEMLHPELQDEAAFRDGLDNIIETQRRVARLYFEDGSIEMACPPLKALLEIMVNGESDGNGLESPEFRALFDPDTLTESDWYQDRLRAKAAIDARLWSRHLKALTTFHDNPIYASDLEELDIPALRKRAQNELKRIEDPDYVRSLQGTLGADPAVV